MKRTPEEILARVEKIKNDDMFGFEKEDLIYALPFAAAKPYLKEGVTEDEWAPITNHEEEIRDYMAFAWDKANNCRGISAYRSLCHMKSWLWLLGDDEVEWLDDYEYYGKPHLVAICERFDIDWKALDNGVWRNAEEEPGETAAVALGRVA